MTIASTLLQILYEIYYYTNKQKKWNSDNRSKLAIVGLIALIFYWLGSYILLYLSRVREYAADAFSAKYTDANLLADALIKIAMGILSTPGDARLVKSTRYIGVAWDAVSKQLGLVYKNCEKSGSFELLGRSLLFDLKSPWAFLAELSSTHPLSGKRIGALMKQTLAPKYDLASIEAKLQIDTNRLYRWFARDLTLVIIARLAPWILGLITLIALLALHIPIEWGFLFVVTGFLVGIVVSMLIKLSMMYPANQDEPTTILEAMGDIYASPVRGRKISLEGQLVGRWIPGYIFSEDMLMQDKTGLIYVDYESRFGWIGNLFYSLKKAAENIGKDVRTSGWFFRDMSSRIVADRITGEGIDLKGGVRLWMLIGIMFMTVVSGVVGVMANTIYTDYTTTEQSKFIATNKESTKEDLIAHPNWKFRDQYDAVYEFSDGVAKVIKGKEGWFINEKWEIIIPIGKYKIHRDQAKSERIVWEKYWNKCILLDINGQELSEFECIWYPEFSEDYNSVITSNGPILIDTDGKTVINSWMYAYIGDSQDGLIPVILLEGSKKLGFINTEWKLIIPDIYDNTLSGDEKYFHQSKAVISKDGLYGLINKENDTLIPFEYQKINTFFDWIAFAKKDGICWTLSEDGVFTSFDFTCTSIWESYRGLSAIFTKSDDGVVDKTGKFIIKGTYNSIDFQNEKIVATKVDRTTYKNTTDIYNLDGTLMYTTKYDVLSNFQKNYGFWKIVNPDNSKKYGYLYPDWYVKWIK